MDFSIKGSPDFKRTFAVDFSRSTEGNTNYHSVTRQIVDTNFREGDIIIMWDHEFKVVSKEEFTNINDYKKGGGGTSPISIAQAAFSLGSNSQDNLILITDGQVDVASIDQADLFIKENSVQFKNVDAFIVKSTNEEGDLSVVCPFIRNCPHKIYEFTFGSSSESSPSDSVPSSVKSCEILTVNQADMNVADQIDSIKTIEEFNNNYSALAAALTARTIGTVGDRGLRNKVIELQSRVAKIKGPIENISTLFKEALENGNYDSALQFGSQLVFDHKIPSDFGPKIQGLIRMCEGALRFTFDKDSIQSARYERAHAEKPFEAADAETITSGIDIDAANPFICPISYENETDPAVIISKPEKPLMFTLGPKTVSQVIDCPLNSLLKKKFMELTVLSVDHPISLTSYREAKEIGHEITISPITRKPILGLIPLGADYSHVKAANWTLSQLFSGGKRLGNPDFWFAYLYFLVEGNKIPYLTSVLPFFREQMIYRLSHSMTSAAMTGLTGYVQRRITLGAAIWFVLASPAFEVQAPIQYDPLRLHLMHPNYLMKLLDLVKYELPDGIKHHIKRLRGLFSLLNYCKWKPNEFKMHMRGIYLKWAMVDITKVQKRIFNSSDEVIKYVPIEGPPSERQIQVIRDSLPRRCIGLSLEEIYGLSTLCNSNLSPKMIPLPLDWKPEPLPEVEMKWDHYCGTEKLLKFQNVQICPSTMRPYYYASNENNQTWKDALVQIVPEVTENQLIFSGNVLYGEFVSKFHKYPTMEELVEFIFNKRVIHGNDKALMKDIFSYSARLVELYSPLVNDVSPAVFIWRFESSACVEKRKKMEKEEPKFETKIRKEIELMPPKGKRKISKKHTDKNLYLYHLPNKHLSQANKGNEENEKS